MTHGCTRLQNAVDWRRNEDLDADLQAHVNTCQTCQTYLLKWRLMEPALKVALAEPDLESAARREQVARMLVERARHDTPKPKRSFRLAVALAGAVVAIFVAAGIGLARQFADHTDAAQTGVVAELPVTVHRVLHQSVEQSQLRTVSKAIEVPLMERRVLAIGDDVIGVDAAGAVRVKRANKGDVLLALERGKIACSVAHRKKGERFVVQSGAVRVQVVGTRFMVHREPAGITVAVTEGVVAVSEGDSLWKVAAGNQLQLDASGRPTLGPAPPGIAEHITRLLAVAPTFSGEAAGTGAARNDIGPSATADATVPPSEEAVGEEVSRHRRSGSSQLSTWRDWILAGRLDEARRALNGQVRSEPADAEAWTLLADCERKSENWKDAVAAYQKVMRLTPGAKRRRAAYRAAAILQDSLGDHRGAVGLLEEYVASAPAADPLGAEAKIRLARSCIQLGNTSRAQILLTDVIAAYPGTPVAARARAMLNTLR